MSERKEVDANWLKLQAITEAENDCIGVGGMMCERLQELLSSMNVPELRKHDVNWLSRNLGVGKLGEINRSNPGFKEVISILKTLRKK